MSTVKPRERKRRDPHVPRQPPPAQPGHPRPSRTHPGPARPCPAQPGPARPTRTHPGPARPSPAQPHPPAPTPAQPGPARPSRTHRQHDPAVARARGAEPRAGVQEPHEPRGARVQRPLPAGVRLREPLRLAPRERRHGGGWRPERDKPPRAAERRGGYGRGAVGPRPGPPPPSSARVRPLPRGERRFADPLVSMAATRSVMRAVRVFEFGGPEVLKLQSDVLVPVPKENQVLIKVHACGVNPVETYIRSGTYARKPALPYTPGSDVAGVIEGVGEHVTAFKKGDRVFTLETVSGGYAEYAVAAANRVFPLPDKLDFRQGAAIGVPYFTAYRALFQKGCAKAGESVLVHGASGGVGLAACQIARACGLKVLGTAGTEEGMNVILRNGAHQAFNHRDPNYTERIKECTGPGGVDIIIEMLSNVNLDADLQLLSYAGRVMVVGCRGRIEINPRDTMSKESSIIGVSLFLATEEERRECATAVLDGIEAGWLKPVVGLEYPLEKVAKAHEDIICSSGARGKMVLLL